MQDTAISKADTKPLVASFLHHEPACRRGWTAERFPASLEKALRGTLPLNREYRGSAYSDDMPQVRDWKWPSA